jgi:hypothetical protein
MTLVVCALVALFVLTACDKQGDSAAEQGAAPPPPPSARLGACKDGAGKVADPVSADFFPRRVAGYCVDPNGETRAYGADAPEGIDKVCIEQFNGECELYKSYGLERLVTLRYVDGGGSPGSVAVNASRFATIEGAYGFFTRRVVGGMDPALRALQQLHAGTSAVLGTGSATVWRDKHVVELFYSNEAEPVDRVAKIAGTLLPTVAKSIGDRLPGTKQLPPAAAALPVQDRLPMGISYELRQLLGVAATGGGAFGYYRQQQKRWRILAVVRPDEAGAQDVLGTIHKALGAKAVKGLAFKAYQFTTSAEDSGPKLEWVMARSGNRVFAVGDEQYVADVEKSADELAKLTLSRQDKLDRLGQLVSLSGTDRDRSADQPPGVPSAVPSASGAPR